MKLKRIGAIAMVIALISGSIGANDVYGMRQQERLSENTKHQIITPFWIEISSISPYISASGNTIYPEVYIKAKSSSASITGTMYLQKYEHRFVLIKDNSYLYGAWEGAGATESYREAPKGSNMNCTGEVR